PMDALAPSPVQLLPHPQLDRVRCTRRLGAAPDHRAVLVDGRLSRVRHRRTGSIAQAARREYARRDRAVCVGPGRRHVVLPAPHDAPYVEALALRGLRLGGIVLRALALLGPHAQGQPRRLAGRREGVHRAVRARGRRRVGVSGALGARACAPPFVRRRGRAIRGTGIGVPRRRGILSRTRLIPRRPPPRRAALLRALRHRNYRLFFSGQSVSLIGTWITRIATSWLVYRLTGSALLLGIVGFCGQIPTLLLAPFAGVLVDRWNRHRILVATQ